MHTSSQILLVISAVITLINAEYELTISPQQFNIKINDNANFSLILKPDAIDNIEVKLSCNDKSSNFDTIDIDCRIIKGIKSNYTLNGNRSEIFINTVGVKAGRATLIAYVNNNSTNTKNAFTLINVGQSSYIDIISAIVGWIYFAAWSISFYPQIWTNFKRKSVVGLNFDYVSLNITGFLCYSFFNVSLYYSPIIQSQYENKYPRSQIPVEVNDVVFALHAVFATIIVISQCIIYEKGNQRVSLFSKVFLVIAWTASAVLVILEPTTHSISWLFILYFFSYIKLAITFIKYIPQAWYNYERKSTEGWSIGNILLDFTGGALSLMQMFLLAYNYDDWITIFTNFTKFGLGMFSILFDILFMVQHYILYRDRSDSDQTRLTNGSYAEPIATSEEPIE